MTDHDPIDTVLAELRADVPEMSEQAFAAGRARVQAIVTPVAVAAAPEQDTTVTPLRKRRLLRSPPRLIASAAAVVALVAGVLVVQTLRSDEIAPIASAAATQLNSAADKIDPIDQPLQPGQYRYVATRSWSSALYQLSDKIGDLSSKIDDLSGKVMYYGLEDTSELWVPADPKEDCLLRQTSLSTLVDSDGEKAGESGVELPGPATTETRVPCGDFAGGSWQQPSTQFLASLPRDPGQLYDRLRRDSTGHGGDLNEEMFMYATDALSTGLVPADLRAALYRVLAKVPGLEITEKVATLDGLTGTAYGMSAHGRRDDVIIDPATGDIIGERTIDQDGATGVPAGTVISYVTVSNPVVVDKIGARR
jgi:hypothetical protein